MLLVFTIIVHTKSPTVVGWVGWCWLGLFLFCVALIIILFVVMKWGYYEKLILKNKNWERKGASLFFPFIEFFFFNFIFFVYIERERVLRELFKSFGRGFQLETL